MAGGGGLTAVLRNVVGDRLKKSLSSGRIIPNTLVNRAYRPPSTFKWFPPRWEPAVSDATLERAKRSILHLDSKSYLDNLDGSCSFIRSGRCTAFRVSARHALTAFHGLYEWGICPGPTGGPYDRKFVTRVIVYDSDGQSFSAKVLAADPCSDVAVLEILGVNPVDPFLEPSVITPTKRQFIWCTGFPDGVLKTTHGRIFNPTVSPYPALGAHCAEVFPYFAHQSSDFHVGYLKLSIEGGNSGGPVMDAEGGVQFILIARLFAEGYSHLALGVPVEYGMKLLEYALEKYQGETVFVNHGELFGK